MDSIRWQKIQALFHEATELPPQERRAFLEGRCDGDLYLVSDVLNLLAEDSRGDSPFDGDIAQIAGEILDDPDSNSLVSKEFGRYRLLRMLGQGGMGIVYLAERRDLGSQVAIKILRDAWLSPARRERFASEQRTLAQLNHPFIARLYDADASPEGTPFFVMEYVEGVSLTQYCQQRRCSLDERLRLFHAACEAVLYAHQRAVIHRDLKPSNILVRIDGSIRLLDFGIAKHLENIGDAAHQQTLTGLRMMTPAYASPEQIRGEPVGMQTDVYSLGVILYELLAGRLPFDSSGLTPTQVGSVFAAQEPEKPSIAAAKNAAVADGPASPMLVSKAAWADLDVLCLTAMHKDVRRRYSSVEALIRDVDHFLSGEPLEARPDSLPYRASKFVLRNRRSVSAAGAGVVAVAGLVVFFTLRLKEERDTANRETAIATEVNKFLSDDLLGRGNPFQSGKASETLADAIQEASPNIDRKFAADPEIAARLHLTIAQALDNRSDFSQAREEYERARELFLKVGGPLSQDAISAQLQRASMEARSFQSKGLENARALIDQQEALLGKIRQPRKDLAVRLDTAEGMLALVQSDAKLANRYFKQASDEASGLPQFDETAKYNLRQRLAFTYIRLGDGATAERLAQQLIAAYSLTNGPDSPYVLRMRLNLAQAYMIERKFSESVAEANAIYPDFVRKFGPDHQLTMQLLTTRAQSEGSMGRFDKSIRDDLAIYNMAVKKQGPLSFYAIATLSDASVAECRANDLADGEKSAREAHDNAIRGFGPKNALTEATLLPLADCLIDLRKIREASKDLDQINAKAVAQLAGDPNWGAGITLAKADIAVREQHFAEARKEIDAVRPIFSRPDAEAYQRRKMEAISAEISQHLKPN